MVETVKHTMNTGAKVEKITIRMENFRRKSNSRRLLGILLAECETKREDAT